MKRAVVFITDGSEEIETLSPVDYLRRAKVDVTLVAVSNNKTVKCSRGVTVTADKTIAELDLNDLPDAVVVPGGMPGTKVLAGDKTVVETVKKMNAEGRLVCAICAAPALVLPQTGVLDGKEWTCYPGMENEAAAFKSKYVSGKAFVKSGNLITGRGPGAAEEFSMEIVKSLMGEAVYSQVKADAQQR